jgi:hypothetical protein
MQLLPGAAACRRRSARCSVQTAASAASCPTALPATCAVQICLESFADQQKAMLGELPQHSRSSAGEG